jgi:hypothetical protein
MSAEEIIISKEYFELSPSELSQISEYASNKADFDDVKSFLMDTKSAFDNERITTSTELDNNIMAHLHAEPANRVIWYNSFWLFLFPKDKQFYKYPAFQLAVSAIVAIGVFGLIDNTSLDQESMAYEPMDDIVEFEETMKYEESAEKSIVELVDLNEKLEKEDEVEPITNSGTANFNVTNKIVLDVPTTVNEVIMSDDTEPYYADLDMDENEEADVDFLTFEETALIGNTEIEKELNNGVQVFELNKESDKVVNSSNAIVTSTDMLNSKNQDNKDLKRDRSKKKTVSASEQVSAATISTEVSLEDEVLDQKVVENPSVSARKAATIEHTPELIQLFFEVK